MKKITILIKPVSSHCNMECKYCFYKDITSYRSKSVKKMSRNIYVSIIIKSLEFCFEPIEIEYCFQGGEPLLAGVEFFKDFINEVEIRNKIHTIHFSIQTNGTLMNKEWIALFKQYHFLVGISLDGIQKTHDDNRILLNHGSFDTVIQAIELLKANAIDFNILTVVTSNMSMYVKEIYKYYKDMKFQFVQFIPCLPPLNSDAGLKPKEFFKFYSMLYDEYHKDMSMHISLFDQIHNLFHGVTECFCGMLGYCSIQFVIEADGNIYPCDFYALDKYILGNIQNNNLRECLNHHVAYHFLKEEKEYSYLCEKCEFYTICQGNCKRQNICMFDDNYCGYKELLEYIKNKENDNEEV